MEKDARSIEKNAVLIIAAVVILFALKSMKAVFIPMVCSFFIYLLFYPSLERLENKQFKNSFLNSSIFKHTVAVVGSSFLVLVIIVIFLASSLYVLDKIVSTLPDYAKMIDWGLDKLSSYIESKFAQDEWVTKAAGSINDGSSSYISNASSFFSNYIRDNWLLAKELFNSVVLVFVYDFFLL